jgi:S-adenosylmethionine/arginine decarboxylase-like enzyme
MYIHPTFFEVKMAVFHKHLLVNATVSRPLSSKESCEKWLGDLVDLIDMKVLIEPTAKYCDTPGNEGVTGAVIIETSHISVHVWDKAQPPYIRMDVYSCKEFDQQSVLDYLDTTMGVYNCNWAVIDRNDDMMLKELGSR